MFYIFDRLIAKTKLPAYREQLKVNTLYLYKSGWLN